MADIINSGTFRRLVVFLVSGLVLLLNKKLGLDISDAEATAFAGLVIAYIAQSALKETAVAKAAIAAGEIDSVTKAADIIRKPGA
jgi:Mg2+/Co2+ transporter CorB